jgi:galacturan 1,4-alpha-galacturonidase
MYTLKTLPALGLMAYLWAVLAAAQPRTTPDERFFERVIMNGSAEATGVKVYPGGPSHGTAPVVNVTWKDVVCENCNYAIQIQQCYGETDTYCSEYSSTGLVRDVLFQNFTGVTSQSVVANLDCPGNGTCEVKVDDMRVIANNGDNTLLCANIPIDTGVNCTTGASG